MIDRVHAGKFIIDVLYEDNHVLVAVKPPNMLSQEDRTGDPDLLLNCNNPEDFEKAGCYGEWVSGGVRPQQIQPHILVGSIPWEFPVRQKRINKARVLLMLFPVPPEPLLEVVHSFLPLLVLLQPRQKRVRQIDG